MLAGDVLERFHVRRPLARGGMGELWLADDDELHDVVLKTVRPDLLDDVDVCRCFRREIAVTALLQHAHIVRHVAHGCWLGLDVLALEHVRGVSLADLLSRAALPLAPALCIAEDLARALVYLHTIADDRGVPLEVVHGDISPQNILIDERGRALLIDFGAAVIRGASAARDAVVCKPGYVSPEQALGDDVDGRSDQYALGIVLWEMLAGRELFEGNGTRKHRAVPPLSTMVSVPFPVEATVIRMLAYDEDARFQCAEEVADAIASAAWAHGIEEARAWLAFRAQHPLTLEGERPAKSDKGSDDLTQPMRR